MTPAIEPPLMGRRVTVSKPSAASAPIQPPRAGTLLGFGLDVLEGHDYAASYTAAIVEFDDGTVELVHPNYIRFVNSANKFVADLVRRYEEEEAERKRKEEAQTAELIDSFEKTRESIHDQLDTLGRPLRVRAAEAMRRMARRIGL